MKFLFWFSLSFILYTYAGYPCLLFVWSKLFPKKVNKAYLSPEPMVSVVVAARNEETNIGARIENFLEQDYPLEKMEIIIVSDGSTDATNDIVRQFASANVGQCALKLIELDDSKGKPNSLNIGVQQATGEFIVFADARQKFEPNAVKELMANFNDPKVGCVSGELLFYEDSDTNIKTEMAFYWNLEKHVRKMESAVGSVAGATGAIYAIRKSLFRPLPDEILLDDVLIPMNAIMDGFRTVFDGNAIAYDTVSKDLSEEKGRKIRTLLGNYQLLQIMPELLSPAKNPIFFRYLSHKVLRLFVPFFFFVFLFSSLMINGLFYKLAFIGTIMIILFPLVDRHIPSASHLHMVSKLSRTFVSLNYFALIAFFYFIRPGKKEVHVFDIRGFASSG